MVTKREAASEDTPINGGEIEAIDEFLYLGSTIAAIEEGWMWIVGRDCLRHRELLEHSERRYLWIET